MGRKRGLPRSAREKVVAEEAAEALDQDIREELVKNKPNEALFVLDSRGTAPQECLSVAVCCMRSVRVYTVDRGSTSARANHPCVATVIVSAASRRVTLSF